MTMTPPTRCGAPRRLQPEACGHIGCDGDACALDLSSSDADRRIGIAPCNIDLPHSVRGGSHTKLSAPAGASNRTLSPRLCGDSSKQARSGPPSTGCLSARHLSSRGDSSDCRRRRASRLRRPRGSPATGRTTAATAAPTSPSCRLPRASSSSARSSCSLAEPAPKLAGSAAMSASMASHTRLSAAPVKKPFSAALRAAVAYVR
mmetsp:Transcript_39676/g.104101  ORF Transcript_39676/g.104101 Transcript_39676/m.104101 type:complete len:204 (+) Transcript_39676:236-847(+)